MNKGLFLTFEGCDGCGKTTVIKEVYEELLKRNISCLLTREPGGSKIAEEIRNIILDRKNTEMDIRTEALLYAASRRQHLIEIILPALKEGKIILCDRYLDSSLAYQGYARGIGIEEVYSINLFATDNQLPDVTFFFDLSAEEGLNRISKNKNREVNRLDLEKLDFHKKVYEGYKKIIYKYQNRTFKIIDAHKTIEEEKEEILSIILNLINNG